MVLDSLHEGLVNNQDFSEFRRLFVLIFSIVIYYKSKVTACACCYIKKINLIINMASK